MKTKPLVAIVLGSLLVSFGTSGVQASDATPATADSADAFETNFPYAIKTKLIAHSPGLPAGDSIVITSLKGDRPHVEMGGIYLIQGQYQLGSADEATLMVAVTGHHGRRNPDQQMGVVRGKGAFTLAFKVLSDGQLHLAFYPNERRTPLGGVFFAEN